MNHFLVEANEYLNESVNGFYHTDYLGYRAYGNPDYIVTLKNNRANQTDEALVDAMNVLMEVLMADLPAVLKEAKLQEAVVCIMPRAKVDYFYDPAQLLFRETVRAAVAEFYSLKDGFDWIERHTHTRTTHLGRYDSVGQLPYIGITEDTCAISPSVSGQDIILVDDVYTKTVNANEDAIQALLNAGANSVTLYTVAKTKKRY